MVTFLKSVEYNTLHIRSYNFFTIMAIETIISSLKITI